jgi:hypothetical protein
MRWQQLQQQQQQQYKLPVPYQDKITQASTRQHKAAGAGDHSC